jgi:hypothetical protein
MQGNSCLGLVSVLALATPPDFDLFYDNRANPKSHNRTEAPKATLPKRRRIEPPTGVGLSCGRRFPPAHMRGPLGAIDYHRHFCAKNKKGMNHPAQ